MLNWYRIERVLGRGGFGVIYLATDTNLDHPVAVKEYRVLAPAGSSETRLLTEERSSSQRQGMQRFIDEARNLVRFKHANIVRVMSVFELNHSAYIVMEYEEGVDLKQHLMQPGAVSEAALKTLFLPIIDGLKHVHAGGFIHRDIKPSNILVRPDGSPVLLDFGSARSPGPVSSETLTALVSAGYAPLEQYSGGSELQQGPWTDIYALGAVLYYSVTGAEPQDSAKRGSALLNGGQDPLIPARLLAKGRYTPAFLDAIDWALQFRISDRPQSLADWTRSLITTAAPDDETRRVDAVEAESVKQLKQSTVIEFDPMPMQGEPVPREVEAARIRRSGRGQRAKRWLGASLLLLGVAIGGSVWWMQGAPGLGANRLNDDALSERSSGSANEVLEGAAAAERAAAELNASQKAADEEAREAENLRAAEEAREAARAQSVLAAAAEEEEAARLKAAAAAAERKRRQARQQQLNRHLDRAMTNLDAGLLDAAEESLDSAALVDRNNARLIQLRSRWRAALVDSRTPVSDEDFNATIARFDQLRRAIESGDVDAVDRLTESSAQNLLFRQLMSRFARLEIKINKIRVRNADKSISAALRIENMVRDNGDRATPSTAYQERTIASKRIEGKWSLIQW